MCLKKIAFIIKITIQYLFKCDLFCFMVISGYIHFPDDHKNYVVFMAEYNSIRDIIDDIFFIAPVGDGHMG